MLRAPALAMTTLLALATAASAQLRPTPPSSVLLHELRKLRDVSSALYLAAHPDDENTRLISYLANGELAETAYLSLTRGDGGQNLIGTDLREGLGVIRTQELLAARRTDGGTQFFTRANDFGYSKHPDETLTFWDRDTLLADMVWVIRRWQPDVIVTRFDPNSAGQTHGHHTTSALLGVEAFALAADSTAFPEQFARGVAPWRAERILFNTSWWFYGSEEAFAAADKSDLVAVDAGAYYPALGLSNGEIAARSRSQHASQGFGSGASRGAAPEYLKLLAGEMPPAGEGLFGGVDDTWGRIPDGAPIETALARAEAAFDPLDPAATVPDLLEALRLMRALPAGRYTRTKVPALERLVADVLGIYVEATAADSVASRGSTVDVSYEVVQRLGDAGDARLRGVRVSGAALDTAAALAVDEPLTGRLAVEVPADARSTPYWLDGEATEGMYAAPDDYELRGRAENPPALTARVALEVDGEAITLTTPVTYKRTLPDRGEVYQPLLIVPEVAVSFAEPVRLWPDGEAREVRVQLRGYAAGELRGEVSVGAPTGWMVEPSARAITVSGRGDEQLATFSVTPPDGAAEAELTAAFSVDDGGGRRDFDQRVRVLHYPHIPTQVIVDRATARAVRLELSRTKKHIGYVAGAGDAVPEALEAVGYEVTDLGPGDIDAAGLAGFDAVVLGIRAYNTQEWLPRVNDELLAYARGGGTVVVQYNTNRGIDLAGLTPYPMTLSRNRVTVEGAPVEFADPGHAVLTTPNALTAADFDGWVQERGLYFPSEWDPAYATPLKMNDPGEDPQRGGLLVADVGEGRYVYTGLSFFRELPAGVPGAYRLFVNLLEGS